MTEQSFYGSRLLQRPQRAHTDEEPLDEWGPLEILPIANSIPTNMVDLISSMQSSVSSKFDESSSLLSNLTDRVNSLEEKYLNSVQTSFFSPSSSFAESSTESVKKDRKRMFPVELQVIILH